MYISKNRTCINQVIAVAMFEYKMNNIDTSIYTSCKEYRMIDQNSHHRNKEGYPDCIKNNYSEDHWLKEKLKPVWFNPMNMNKPIYMMSHIASKSYRWHQNF